MSCVCVYLAGVEEGAAPPAGFSSVGLSSLAVLSDGVSAAGPADEVGLAVAVVLEAVLVAVAADDDEEADAGAALGCRRNIALLTTST